MSMIPSPIRQDSICLPEARVQNLGITPLKINFSEFLETSLNETLSYNQLSPLFGSNRKQDFGVKVKPKFVDKESNKENIKFDVCFI